MECGDGQDEVDFPIRPSVQRPNYPIRQSVQRPNFLDFILGRHWVKIMEQQSKRIVMMTIKTTPTQLREHLIL